MVLCLAVKLSISELWVKQIFIIINNVITNVFTLKLFLFEKLTAKNAEVAKNI
jgi:hypothetical protein